MDVSAKRLEAQKEEKKKRKRRKLITKEVYKFANRLLCCFVMYLVIYSATQTLYFVGIGRF